MQLDTTIKIVYIKKCMTKKKNHARLKYCTKFARGT